MQLTCTCSSPISRLCWDTPDLRLCGTLLSDGVTPQLLATFVDGAWRRKGAVCEPIHIHGPLRLLFGIPRHPARATRAFDRLTLAGTILEADGTPFARYLSDSDMWQALQRPMWWHSLHILAAQSLPLSEPPWPEKTRTAIPPLAMRASTNGHHQNE